MRRGGDVKKFLMVREERSGIAASGKNRMTRKTNDKLEESL